MEDQILFCMYYVIQGYIFVHWAWSATLKGRLLAEGTVNVIYLLLFHVLVIAFNFRENTCIYMQCDVYLLSFIPYLQSCAIKTNHTADSLLAVPFFHDIKIQ
jgi:hypothetical protein